MVCTDATGGAPGCCPALLDPWASGLPPAYLTLIRTGSGHANIRMGKSLMMGGGQGKRPCSRTLMLLLTLLPEYYGLGPDHSPGLARADQECPRGLLCRRPGPSLRTSTLRNGRRSSAGEPASLLAR
jgi:hypothetical protein